jgi:hypothetical protein
VNSRGLAVSDSDEDIEVETSVKNEKFTKTDETPGWMKKSTGSKAVSTRSRKSKTVYRTVDEVIALVERETAQQQQQTKVVDYTGPQVRTITSTDIRSTPTGQATSTRFMELRHNLNLLTDMARNDIARCGKEKRLITAQHAEADTEYNLLESKIKQQQKGKTNRSNNNNNDK